MLNGIRLNQLPKQPMLIRKRLKLPAKRPKLTDKQLKQLRKRPIQLIKFKMGHRL
ncbi:hypothetical protein [Sporosarcina jiandibaonis]|uniref:hypothetical protein n=1 Tax=Sporosarcina jiandibaonis TaxID=2715535 RepID=UPI0015519A9A|nr:hypothetical protein [Sporosarcina jiandibaonis]